MGLRTTLALAALLSLATAQTRTFSTVGDIVPSATASISGPIQTNRACAQIQDVVRESDDSAPIVPAEVSQFLMCHWTRRTALGGLFLNYEARTSFALLASTPPAGSYGVYSQYSRWNF